MEPGGRSDREQIAEKDRVFDFFGNEIPKTANTWLVGGLVKHPSRLTVTRITRSLVIRR
jgi:hypothetical protein